MQIEVGSGSDEANDEQLLRLSPVWHLIVAFLAAAVLCTAAQRRARFERMRAEWKRRNQELDERELLHRSDPAVVALSQNF